MAIRVITQVFFSHRRLPWVFSLKLFRKIDDGNDQAKITASQKGVKSLVQRTKLPHPILVASVSSAETDKNKTSCDPFPLPFSLFPSL